MNRVLVDTISLGSYIKIKIGGKKMSEVKPKIEPQEVHLVNGKEITFHCQTIPVILPSGLLMSEPNKTYSWYFPNSSILKSKVKSQSKS